jgi:threonine/homoserine/homoserine lactone efflux protein
MTWELWASFVVIAGAAIVTPGPGNLNTLRRAVELGHRPALFCLFGNVIGLAILGAATTLGLIALLVTTPFLWSAFQWVALGLLVFLALQMMTSSSPPQFGHGSVSTGNHLQLLFEAIAVSALNPKAAVFYIAVFPLYTDPMQPFVPQATLIIVTCLVISAVSHGVYIFLAGVTRHHLSAPSRYRMFRVISGLVMLGLAAWLFSRMMAR